MNLVATMIPTMYIESQSNDENHVLEKDQVSTPRRRYAERF